VADKKARVRKAPTLREEAEAARASAGPGAEPSKLSAAKNKLPKLGIFRILGRLLRPLRWLIPSYFINSWREVRQVTWPNRRETWRLTLAVFIFAVVFGTLIAGVDKGLDFLFKKVILKQ
jgi:preprotein translocase SecE subunit